MADQIAERLSRLETALVEAAGENPLAEIVDRIDKLDARLTTLEIRQRRPPPFAVTLISNETRKPEPVEPHPLVEKFWQRKIEQESERVVEQRLKSVFSTLHQQAAQFALMRDRLAAVEARTTTSVNETKGG
jgi:hypothetical protein